MSGAGTSAPNYSILLSRFAESRQWDRALSTAKEWLSVEPESAQAHLSAGQALVNLRRYPEAASHITQVLARQPQNHFAHRLLSIVHFHGRRFKEADAAIQTAISIAPNDSYHWYHLAWMSYKQGDLKTGKTCAEKARELNPRDPDTINLLALCEPRAGAAQLQRYHDALALNPTNAVVHNNIGVYHLNATKDYAAAEESFRRALNLDPTSALFRKNLFLTLKHRDRIYRILSAPKDFLVSLTRGFAEARRKNVFLYIFLIPVALLGFHYVLGGMVLWALFIWPMLRCYEHLTIGDLRAQAGEIGGATGGWFGYRCWPRGVRMILFAVALAAFWAGIVWSCRSEEGLLMVAAAAPILALGVLTRRPKRISRGDRAHAQRRAKAVRSLLCPQPPPLPGWHPFRRTPPSK